MDKKSKEYQDSLRARTKRLLNNRIGIASNCSVESGHFYKWYAGFPGGKQTLAKIEAGLTKMEAEFKDT